MDQAEERLQISLVRTQSHLIARDAGKDSLGNEIINNCIRSMDATILPI